MTIRIGSHEFDHVRYDEHGDVLYLSIGPPREPAGEVLTPEGHAVRLDERGVVIGITLINARWLVKHGGLKVSLPIPVPADDLTPAFG